MKQDATMKMKATAEHFSQANPAGPGQDDIPSLLRRVAESVEAIGPVGVQDLILHTEVTEHGPWYSLTVYFQRLTDPRAKNRKQRKSSLSRPTSRSSRTRPKRRAS
jgi:hypothetical protein